MNKQNPLVSICSLAYNHEPFIRQCLDGFMMQNTNFPFEVLIHDDASTDGTADIIREYEAKYPDIIKPIYQTENQYSKGCDICSNYLFSRAKGKYIALCEGDDYWTDPYKLQRQVDFLEAHEVASMCFHDAKKIDLIGNKKGDFRRYNKDQYASVENLIVGGGGFCPTASLVFRTQCISDYPDFCKNCFVGDYPLQLYLSFKGKIYYFDNKMSIYRKGVPNSFTQTYSKIDYSIRIEKMIDTFKMLDGINALFNYKYSSVILQHQIDIIIGNLALAINTLKYENIILVTRAFGKYIKNLKVRNRIKIVFAAIMHSIFKLFQKFFI